MDCFVARAPRKKVGLSRAITTYHRTLSSIRVGPQAGTELAMMGWTAPDGIDVPDWRY
jgi:hypothetical protein